MRVQSSCATTDGVSSSAIEDTWRIEILQQITRAALFAAQVHAQAAGDIVQIAFALVQVGVLDVVEHRGNLVEGALHGPLGVDALGGDQVGRAADQHRIVEHEELRIEDGREVGAFQLCDPPADLLELLVRAPARAARAPTARARHDRARWETE